MVLKRGKGRPIKLENGLECGKSTTNPGMYEDSDGTLYTFEEATAWSRKCKEARRPKRDRSGRVDSRRNHHGTAVPKKPMPEKTKAKKLIG